MSPRGDHPNASLAQAWRNWARSTLRYMNRSRLFLNNTRIKLQRLDSCCGNYGQPGC